MALGVERDLPGCELGPAIYHANLAVHHPGGLPGQHDPRKMAAGVCFESNDRRG
jgi:hypothetical protein